VLPLLRFRRERISWPKVNTLASLFLELKLPSLSDHWSHIQISPVNDFVLRRLGVDPSSFAEAEKPWFTSFLERLMIAWCGIHSDHSSLIAVTLIKTGGDRSGTLRLDHEPAQEEQRYSRKLAYALARKGWRFRSAFLAPLRIDSKPGAGNHVGGSFPMAKSPRTKFETDILGRPRGLYRVHIIDSSIFPSIPATTVLLPIMANADRIATQTTLS
jgi:choline dehydrogenase-like flavoprotein